jgi:hypothetical protein
MTIRFAYNLFFITFVFTSAIAQHTDTIKASTIFSGNINVTNNGISLVPTFTLGKPATVIDLSVRKKRLSFEPQLRFALEGAKPWSFIYWMRYKIVEGKKFNLHTGVHPSYVFSNSEINIGTDIKEITTVKRYWAGELAQSLRLSNRLNLGVYYLHAYGIGKDITKHSQLLAINASFSNVKLYKKLGLKYAPQVFYLKLDNFDGYYFTQTLTLTFGKLPFNLSSITTKALQTKIPSKDFVWNISVNYQFN